MSNKTKHDRIRNENIKECQCDTYIGEDSRKYTQIVWKYRNKT